MPDAQLDATFFPVMIRRDNGALLLCNQPSELPVGDSFVIMLTNSSERELELAKRLYSLGWDEGRVHERDDY